MVYGQKVDCQTSNVLINGNIYLFMYLCEFYVYRFVICIVRKIEVKDTCKIKEQTTVYGTETAQKGTVQQSGKNGS